MISPKFFPILIFAGNFVIFEELKYKFPPTSISSENSDKVCFAALANDGSVTGEVLMSDSISLIDRAGLCGGEYLNLQFTKKRYDTPDNGISKKFRIYRVSERILKNQETENYTLNFCSEEFFLSEQMKISKAYKGMTISEMVSDIMEKELKEMRHARSGQPS